MKKNEVRKGYFGQKLVYSRTETEGEGFGKRKVGMRCKVKFYKYEDVKGKEYRRNIGTTLEEGTIVQITRRINCGFYDYWYKVRLDDGTHVWRSFVILE